MPRTSPLVWLRLGFRYKDVKLEGSAFTGREPDEHRYDFDKPAKFDSYSVRLSVQPIQTVGLAGIKRLAPKSRKTWSHMHNVNRFTASAIHTKMHWAMTAMWLPHLFTAKIIIRIMVKPCHQLYWKAPCN
jgi:hypothetical protein